MLNGEGGTIPQSSYSLLDEIMRRPGPFTKGLNKRDSVRFLLALLLIISFFLLISVVLRRVCLYRMTQQPSSATTAALLILPS
jgi:hypothetical protein